MPFHDLLQADLQRPGRRRPFPTKEPTVAFGPPAIRPPSALKYGPKYSRAPLVLIHGGGANESDKPRKALVNTYCLGWLRQEENQNLSLDKEDVDQLSDPVRRLLGFQAHGPFLGVWPDDPDGLWYKT